MARLFVAKYGVPIAVSIASVSFLGVQGQVSTNALVGVGLGYASWLGTAWWFHRQRIVAERKTIKSADFNPKEQKLLSSMSEVDKYYIRLLQSLNESAEVMDFTLRGAIETSARMHDGVRRAHELAKNTGLLAANAMMSASACGEVGRGFVSVSKDLVKISERSEKDLVRLDAILGSVHKLLASHSYDLNPAQRWLEAQLAGLDRSSDLTDAEELIIRLKGYQQTLNEISENYESASQLDVRWLQLGEAIKRVINELNISLLSLTESAEMFAKEMRILQISDKLCETQLLEIKESLMKSEQLDKNFEEIAS